MPKGARIKGVYGKPWSRLTTTGVTLDERTLRRLGRALVAAVVAEARVDFARQGKSHIRGKPEGLPDTEDFFKSFSYRLSGKSTIEILSSWPWIEQLIEGRDPYPMTWLTRNNGVNVVPILKGEGVVLFRTAPLKTQDAWIHPGFARHTFLQRGIKKGREEMARIVSAEATRTLMKGNPFR